MRWPRSRIWLVLALAVAMVATVVVVVVVVRGGAEKAAPPVATTTSASMTTTTTTPSSSTTTTPATTTTVPTGPAVAVRRGNPDRAVVTLTFDAGSDTGYAAEILDILAANGIDATFGMTGQWADANPALVRRMVAEGHQLVNHSYNHPSFTGRSTGTAPLSQAARLDQLARAEAAVQAAAGVTMVPWFRPPYGDDDASVRDDVALAGYRYELLWTVDSLGWRGTPPDDVVRRCLDQAVPGAIYLFHVGAASTDHIALQAIIDGLRERGYRFATAAELVAANTFRR